MQKILIVNSYYYPTIIGGAEISTQILSENLAAEYEVHVITVGMHKRGIITEVHNNVTIHRIPCLNIYSPLNKSDADKGIFLKLAWHIINIFHPAQYFMLKSLVEKIGPDIIHTQNLMGVGTYIWNIARKFCIPIIHTTRDYALVEPVKSRVINNFIYKINMKRSRNVEYFIGISEYILKYHKDNNLFENAKNSVIGNVVDAQRFSRRNRKNKEPLIIGYFGQVSSNKGVMTLVQAVESLSEEVVEKLIICGTGDIVEQIKKKAQTDKRIVLRGKIPQQEVYREMANVDLTVVPSRWAEPFGRVIIESYQQGTPVIATSVGGIPELIENKKMLFQQESIKSLKDKINWLYAMPEEQFQQLIDESYDSSDKFRDNIKEHTLIYDSFIKKL
ncbi:glycosyltransferase family 4 protein [Priestia aryabhattai]|uniref:glycosyltransferase family 4 protein n=1 Tax=Priestia aryabhattai TaxID=412384 RepID=UPI000BFC06AA|nr:glycosyltransferase family 4 protein [Priestia aryabhattai]PHF78027.1 glycoside hydrolase [Priestia aryabhattai]